MKKRTIMAVLLAAGVSSACHFPDIAQVNVPYTAYAAVKGTVTGSNLRVRTGAGTDKEALAYKGTPVMLSKGTQVTVKKAVEVGETTWYQVSFTYEGQTLTGYVSGDYVSLEEEKDNGSGKNDADEKDTNNKDDKDSSSSSSTAVATEIKAPGQVSASSLNVRKTASTSGKKVTSLSKGASVQVLKEKTVSGKKWYYISFTANKKTQKGYVLSSYVRLTLSKNIAGAINSSSAVKIRKGAGTDKPYLKTGSTTISLKNKTDLIVKKETTDAKGGKWFQVSFYYKDKLYSGYVSESKVKLSKVVTVTGKVTGTSALNVRVAAGTDKKQLTYNKANVKLAKGETINILGQTEVKGTVWYQGSFSYKGKTLKGFVSGDYIKITKTTGVPESIKKAAESGNNSNNNSSNNSNNNDTNNSSNNNNNNDNNNDSNNNNNNSNNSSSGDGNNNSGSNGNNSSDKPMSSAEFENYMEAQGFPESYRSGLRDLHEKHPTWVFKAYQTGLNWKDAVASESKVGLNLISINKTNGWKSYEEKAYDWATNTFIPYDGSTWVTASKEAVAYYMDPRNFLTERAVFQFEALGYQTEYETAAGVEKILANTPMYQKSFTYEDEAGGKKEITYAQAFIEAAAASGVSPYHLASRAKQEVVSGTTTLSGSANGKFSGYEGYYNFYNIGATHSTESGGAIANGLSYAKGDSRTTAAAKAEYMIPWNNPYKAIVGGAKYIGKQYINRGQNTIYLQKFNVTGTSTYSHQYMANVEAANSEATKLYNGFSSMLDNMPIVFNIPVYNSMPAKAAETPEAIPCPNNWLKALKFGSYSLSPAFKASNGSKAEYVLDLSKATAESLTITATPASEKAAIEVKAVAKGKETSLGKGTSVKMPIKEETTMIKIVVTSEAGITNTYTINIAK